MDSNMFAFLCRGCRFYDFPEYIYIYYIYIYDMSCYTDTESIALSFLIYILWQAPKPWELSGSIIYSFV